MNETERHRMRELCTAIAAERDPDKMVKLLEELNRLLETKQERLDRKQQAKAS
jgi:hypothetical protein